MEVTVRKFKIEDATSIQKNIFPNDSVESVRKELESEFTSMEEGVYLRCVAEVNNEIVGQACFYNLESFGKKHIVRITSVEVNDAFRGQGICTKLFKFGQDWVKTLHHVEFMILNVRKGTKAADVYAHYGFKQYGLLPRGIVEENTKEAFDELFMVKTV